ncbi:Hsp70 family protein [Paracoccus liaowanqingii]|uniref:Hsp70 family protein n=1 Tax=Paracoccus liaowanqingii TaxID=2560053 RepID=A0A4Z1CQE3_9RHOB|nr:Hsp70 family protein [Paracoccus liaowanqingii]TGN67176.1 Hsp70 family protein [Paracoccus liaowanqingii]
MAGQSGSLGIDFGTSNSAAGHLVGGRPRLIPMAPGQTTMPTTFFIDTDARRLLMGEAANRALLDGREGRFMRALKRVLGTGLMHEPRQILSERVTFVDIIARFLNRIKTTAEAETGLTFRRALSGRPVVFHGADDPREDQALEDLRRCYLAAGFDEVAFLPEPEAAAIASGVTAEPGAVGLIVDVGGGTSDFSLFQAGADGVSILASHGIRIGGTDFDRAINLDRVMPLLGKGSTLRRAMGPGHGPVPNAIYNELATWERIAFVYTPQNRRLVAEMARLADEPARIARLARVLEDELGHDTAFAVEAGKIAANDGLASAAIALDQIQPGLSAPLPPDVLAQILSAPGQQLREAARETLHRAGLQTGQVDRVIYVGGSSLMAVVGDSLRAEFPDARHSVTEVFTAVTDGLAIAAAR